MQIIAPCWSSQYSILGLSVERLSASHQSSLFQCWDSSASSMSNDTCVHRTAPSASWQPPCRKIFVECLEMFSEFTIPFVFCSCWDSFPISVTESNWKKLWLWRSCIPYWRMSTCRLCSRSPAGWRLRWWRPLQKSGGQSHQEYTLSFALLKSLWQKKPTQVFDFVVSWRYLYFNHLSSCRFEHFNSRPWSDLQEIGESWLWARTLRIPRFWVFSASKRRAVPSITDSLVMQNCQFSAVLAIAAWFRSFQNHHLAILREWHRVASSLWHVSLFLRNQCQLLGFEIDLLFVFRCFRCEYFLRLMLLANSIVIRSYIACQHGIDENLLVSKCTLQVVSASSFPQMSMRDNGCVAGNEISGGQYDTWMCQPFVRFVGISVPPCLFWSGLREAPVSWLEFWSQTLPLLWHCANRFLFCLSLFNVVWTWTWRWSSHHNILDFARSSIPEYASWCQEWKHLGVRAKWIALLGLPNAFFGKAMFVPFVLQCCCLIVGGMWLWVSNTECSIWEHVNFHAGQFCCWINSATWFLTNEINV